EQATEGGDREAGHGADGGAFEPVTGGGEAGGDREVHGGARRAGEERRARVAGRLERSGGGRLDAGGGEGDDRDREVARRRSGELRRDEEDEREAHEERRDDRGDADLAAEDEARLHRCVAPIGPARAVVSPDQGDGRDADA